jgi:hypothetical protein
MELLVHRVSKANEVQQGQLALLDQRVIRARQVKRVLQVLRAHKVK